MAKNWLAPFIENSKVPSQEALADALGVSRATVNRLANDHSKLKLDRAQAMAPLLGVTPEDLMLNRLPWEASTRVEPLPDEVTKQKARTILAAVRATVEAGAWREVDQYDQSEPEWIPLDPDPRFPNVTHDIYKVAGDSMNKLEPNPITPGSRVSALRFDEIRNRFPLTDGLIVVVERTRDGGHIRELSIKQVAWFDDRIEFQPRSSNPIHKPIVIQHDSWEDGGMTVEIVGLVNRIMHDLL